MLLILLLLLLAVAVLVLAPITVTIASVIAITAIAGGGDDILHSIEDDAEDRCLRTIHLHDRVPSLLATCVHYRAVRSPS